MRIDLHNHTILCHHATGTIEDYIQTAIGQKIDIFGFSDHAPIANFNDGYRMDISQVEGCQDNDISNNFFPYNKKNREEKE